MNDKAPDRFERLLDDVPVGHAPVDRLLAAGHTAKRRRRAAVAGAATAMAVVAGGVAIGANSIGGNGDDPTVAAPTGGAVAVDLPTNDWTPGAPSHLALISGTIAVDEDNCVYLTSGPTRRYATWPSGYTATIDSDGLHLFDADGTEVAQDGDTIRAGGGVGAASQGSGRPCLPDSEEAVHITSEVEVTDRSSDGGPGEGRVLDLPTSDWEPGDGAMEALIVGTVAVDEKGCVFLAHGQDTGSGTYVVWPAGYTATLGPAGVVLVFGPDGGDPVAREGYRLEVGGGYGPAASDHPCLPDSGEVAYMQEDLAGDGDGRTGDAGEVASPVAGPCGDAVRPTTPGAGTALVYFVCESEPLPEEALRPFHRPVPDDATLEERLRAVVTAHFDGPTDLEGDQLRAIGPAGGLNGVEVEGSRAIIDLNLDLIDASTSFQSSLVWTTLRALAFQFPQIHVVEPRHNGSCDAFGLVVQAGDCTLARRDPAR